MTAVSKTDMPPGDAGSGRSPQPLPGPPKSSADLRPRLIAGAVMAAVALGLDYAGLIPFAALVLLVALLMCWEWGRVIRGENFGAAFVIHSASVGAAVVLAGIGHVILAFVAALIGVVLMLAMPFGPRRLMSAAGIFYVGLPAIAMLWFRGDEPYGFMAVLFIFAVVWSSDIAAFAAGRTFGGPKLWPSVSPNKTWSGFAGGVSATAIVGAVFAYFIPEASVAGLVATSVGLGLVAQLGDLAESALKRGFGVKDSSTIIPGHGGVMDRADSTVTVSVVAALLALTINIAAPARALLLGQ